MLKREIAIYPGTFDPLTCGHEDLVRRAAELFDEVVLAVAESRGKIADFYVCRNGRYGADCAGAVQAMFGLWALTGLLMDFVHAQKAKVLIRGLRAVSDFEYEFQMAGMNRRLYPEVETVFLTPGERHMFVSATMVREIARLGGDVSSFVSPHVNACFVARGWGKPSP